MIAILAGQLFGTALACGLNLYATLALLGVASRAGWIGQLPPGMRGLENGVVIGIAAALYLIEFVVDRLPLVGNAWEAVHTLIRPAAAGLLAYLAFAGASLYLQAGAAAAAAAIALAAHGSKAGLRLIIASSAARHPEHPRRPFVVLTLVSLAEDIAAVGVALAALLYPGVATFVALVSVLLLVSAGPLLWRASMLGVRALAAWARGFFGGRGWRTREQLPRSLRGVIPIEPLGRSPARATAAAISGLPGVGAYRNGWLVFTCDGPRFAYRSFFRPRIATLPGISEITVRRGIITDALYARTNGEGRARVFTIFLLKDGPRPQVPAAELTVSGAS